MYVCFLHIPPENSSYSIKYGDQFELLEQEILKFSNLGNIMLCGDFNARTADNTDFIINDNQNDFNCYDDEYVFDLCDKRVNNDRVISTRGRQLLDKCIKSSLRIGNGRVLGELCGNFTCYNKSGSSVIDNVIINEECISNVLYMKIDDLMRSLSDHCKLSIAISVYFLENSNGAKLNLQSMPVKVK